jgi:hypothetical protein
MKAMQPLALLLIFLFSSVTAMYFAASCSAPYVPPPVVVAEDPLTEAIKSAILIHIDYNRVCGSGTLIGRKQLKSGNWEYSVLTACHVANVIREGIRDDPDEIENILKIAIVYQEHFHAPLRKLHTSIISLEWMIPTQDWAIFTIELPVKLPCAQLATRQEFKSIQPHDHIYSMGADNGSGLFFREGVIASTTAVDPYPDSKGEISPWDTHPNNYFRVYQSYWYGASGCPIFNRAGKIIGIFDGYFKVNGNHPVTHLTIATKGYLILEALTKTQSQLTTIGN